MNAFSKDYQPQVKLDDAIRENKISQSKSKQRQQAMASGDEEARRKAAGTIPGGLSKRGRRKGKS